MKLKLRTGAFVIATLAISTAGPVAQAKKPNILVIMGVDIRWYNPSIYHPGTCVPAQVIAAKWLDTFRQYPIRQNPASFNLDEVMRKLSEAGKESN
jgi:hypothetical protein